MSSIEQRTDALVDLTEQIRRAIMRKVEDVCIAETAGGIVLLDGQTHIAIELFNGDRYTLTVEAEK